MFDICQGKIPLSAQFDVYLCVVGVHVLVDMSVCICV